MIGLTELELRPGLVPVCEEPPALDRLVLLPDDQEVPLGIRRDARDVGRVAVRHLDLGTVPHGVGREGAGCDQHGGE